MHVSTKLFVWKLIFRAYSWERKILLIGLTPLYDTKYANIVSQRKCMHRSLAIIYKTMTTMASNITGAEKNRDQSVER